MKLRLLPVAALALLLGGCQSGKKETYEKHVQFPAEATLEEKVDMASRLVPTAEQLEWQQMELTAFLHFGINTFTGHEWGSGQEDPALFNPEKLDAEQWVKVLKDSGFKMAILTAKHHDGFCLWPTKTTEHSVKSATWKDGQGDVVRELKEACDKYGLRFGVYLSPWDRNASCYGSDEYNDFFIEQLTELLTQYGDVYEVWFDGACGEGPNGKRQEYDWERILSTIRELQPKAVTAIMGDDVRWVGNESGLGRPTEWSATVLAPSSYERAERVNSSLKIDAMAKDLGSRELLANANELFWYPSEVDVSIRPGWFYHKEQDNQVKSVEHLVDIYFQSVGYNSVLLLNIPPDRDGLINQSDAARLYEFSNYIKNHLSTNLVNNATVHHVVDAGESVEFNLEENNTFNTLMVKEDISQGQRIEEFTIEAEINGEWKELAKGTTVGYKRLIRLDNELTATNLRLTINSTRAEAHIIELGAYNCPPAESATAMRIVNEFDNTNWTILSPKGEENEVIIDGDISTDWEGDLNDDIIVDLGRATEFKGFIYTPSHLSDDHIFKYNFAISADGKEWTELKSNEEFSNIRNNPVTQAIYFEKEVTARFVKLTPLESSKFTKTYAIAELGLLKK